MCARINLTNRLCISLLENTGDSDTGAHVNEVLASLRADGFSDVEVSSALNRLCNEGIVYSTIDEHHFNLANTSTSAGQGRIRSRYAYGSALNDAIIRVLRDLGGEILSVLLSYGLYSCIAELLYSHQYQS